MVCRTPTQLRRRRFQCPRGFVGHDGLNAAKPFFRKQQYFAGLCSARFDCESLWNRQQADTFLIDPEDRVGAAYVAMVDRTMFRRTFKGC